MSTLHLFNLDTTVIILTTFAGLISTLISVAYFTLMERKVLAAMQRRRGPNSVGFYGILQPLADGLKLIGKEGVLPNLAIKNMYLVAPCISMVMSFSGWIALPLTNFNTIEINSDLDLLLFFCISSLGSYGVVLAGWSSFSRYAVMGALRAISQLISYEVIFLLAALPPVILAGGFNFAALNSAQSLAVWNIFPCAPSALIFFILLLAETNRTPFDLPEAEAELVSGFNVEYSSVLFAMFSLAEYNSMLMMSTFFSILFLGGWSEGSTFDYFFFVVKTLFIAYLIVASRAKLPRYRYDQLMYLCWYILLPLCLGTLMLTAGIVMYFNIQFYDSTELLLEVQKKNDWYYEKYWGNTYRD